jgi:meso-butanediol dehydrogenase / (S,S)-butanediol dehydrogenase / diacetyl reductase
MSLEGHSAIVTGAARGIGRGIARSLAQAGANVAVVDLRIDDLKDTLADIKAAGQRGLAVEADVTQPHDVEAMIDKTVATFGKLDIAVNNAGIFNMSAIEDMSLDTWNQTINVNLTSVFLCCKVEVVVMRDRRFGRIINTASMCGKVGLAEMTHYCASKFGVIGLTNALAKEVARDGITVNCVCPGTVATDMLRTHAKEHTLPGETIEEAMARMQASMMPQGVGQTVEDIGQAVVFLATSPHVLGQALAIDGGYTL